jgi:uncharacterized membrane protein
MAFLQDLAYRSIGGFPVLGYLGIIGYLLLIATALVMILTRRKVVKIKPKVHFRLAYATLIVATVHALLAISVYI